MTPGQHAPHTSLVQQLYHGSMALQHAQSAQILSSSDPMTVPPWLPIDG